MFLSFLYIVSLFILNVFAATAEQWRSRSIYQLFTDRYALPSGTKPTECDPGAQTWCGGTWNSIRENLDYIQDVGFTAVWISPVSKNYDGPRTKYGDAYTGYWITDVSQLNDRFGTADDLKALSAELHKRGMYLMVDLVLNNVMATSTTPDYSQFFLKDKSMYHPYCAIEWGNRTSEENCWLGDTTVPLPDVNTENPAVTKAYENWIGGFIKEYSIDGLRIDAAKHAPANFWTPICAKAGVFCMGEVFGDDIDLAASYQGPQALDSVLNFPVYNALVQAFTIPGPRNMTALVHAVEQSRKTYKDVTVLGNFLENQDVPRWSNMSVDTQSMLNAMVFTFMADGIPIVYYGQEQQFSGIADPWNREALWPSNYANTTVYSAIASLNKLRNFLVSKTDSTWASGNAEILSTTDTAIAVIKGNVLSVMTNVGSPPHNSSIGVYTPWDRSTSLMDVLSCTQWAVGSNDTVSVEYSRGGRAVVLVPIAELRESGLCGYEAPAAGGLNAQQSASVPLCGFHSSLFIVFSVLFTLGHLL